MCVREHGKRHLKQRRCCMAQGFVWHARGGGGGRTTFYILMLGSARSADGRQLRAGGTQEMQRSATRHRQAGAKHTHSGQARTPRQSWSREGAAWKTFPRAGRGCVPTSGGSAAVVEGGRTRLWCRDARHPQRANCKNSQIPRDGAATPPSVKEARGVQVPPPTGRTVNLINAPPTPQTANTRPHNRCLSSHTRRSFPATWQEALSSRQAAWCPR